jgi:hypothetical protein
MIMNDEDIRQFMTAFKDFMKHAETEIDAHKKWQEARNYVTGGNHRLNFIEKKAAELNVSVDYYLQEFV